MKLVPTLLLCAASLPLAAQDMEQILLPVQPSFIMCGRNARFDTRLVLYNQNQQAVRPACGDDLCGAIAPGGHEITGATTGASLPTFLYLPKSEADHLRMSLVVESSDNAHPEDRAFEELPIVRASEFRDKTMSIVGVRMEPGFRQALRIYSLDGTSYSAVNVRAFDFATDALIYEEVHWLAPISDERTANGDALRPSFNMECDLSAELPELLDGRNVRIELEPLTEGLKFWAFVSITNNKTQHFYTITPR